MGETALGIWYPTKKIEKIEKIKVSSIGREHIVSDTMCNIEWCDGGKLYPKPCECGGCIHAEFGDESYYCDYYIITRCDKCNRFEMA